MISSVPHKKLNILYPNLLQKEVKDENCRVAEMKIQAAIGFRHVIDLLSAEKKLIVGHNCFLGTIFIPSFMKRLLSFFSITNYSPSVTQILHMYTANS